MHRETNGGQRLEVRGQGARALPESDGGRDVRVGRHAAIGHRSRIGEHEVVEKEVVRVIAVGRIEVEEIGAVNRAGCREVRAEILPATRHNKTEPIAAQTRETDVECVVGVRTEKRAVVDANGC